MVVITPSCTCTACTRERQIYALSPPMLTSGCSHRRWQCWHLWPTSARTTQVACRTQESIGTRDGHLYLKVSLRDRNRHHQVFSTSSPVQCGLLAILKDQCGLRNQRCLRKEQRHITLQWRLEDMSFLRVQKDRCQLQKQDWRRRRCRCQLQKQDQRQHLEAKPSELQSAAKRKERPKEGLLSMADKVGQGGRAERPRK